MKRRQFIRLTGASLLLWKNDALSDPLSVNAVSKCRGDKSASPSKLIWIILRGAMDSLHTIVPTFDQQLSLLRPTLLGTINHSLLPLDSGYALHPALVNCHQWYKNNEFSPIVAVGSGYGGRSHFSGQDYLEHGTNMLNYASGWLGRAIDIKHKKALAIARTTPISLRGASSVNTWYPSNIKDSSDDLHNRILAMYKTDPLLSEHLQQGLLMQDMAGMMKGKVKKGQFISLAKSCAKLMHSYSEIDCAMLEVGGWDTHNNQANALNRQLKNLDQGLAALKEGLQQQWKNTVIVVATEFGRTAKENGTQGTDHGTGSAMILAGGALSKSAIHGKWPGLRNDQLFEQRDLQPTTNTFSWIATVLQQHWQLSDQELAKVLPNYKPYQVKLIC